MSLHSPFTKKNGMWNLNLNWELSHLHWHLRSKYYFMIRANKCTVPFSAALLFPRYRLWQWQHVNLIQPAFPCWVVKSFTCETLHLSYSFSRTSSTFKNYIASVSPEVCVFCNWFPMESPLKLYPLNPSFIWQALVWTILFLFKNGLGCCLT